ncbi:MAG: 1-deoxy-D-xylulose-5-phosphate reductoisomerase [Sulfurospirillum sp.]|nr:MAG: 1-deoxy-D-xylulose-5-phosphate reductoisomerase [Sulfurospirillum sp.]
MIVLGSTGSIGVNALHIAKRFDLPVEVLVAGNNIDLLNRQIAEVRPKCVVVAQKESVPLVLHDNVLYGEEGILDAIRTSMSALVVNSLVGFAGLRPTIEAIQCKKRVALANKESLVVAGQFIDISKIDPIDSEHFGLWYLLQDRPVEKMTVTASGGSFRDTPLHVLEKATVEEALNHPNWSMGRKITIDSATMTNKLFELLEAKWLFGIDKLDALIETKSIIHALIDFKDGSTTAHIANADMKLPIAFALLGSVEEQILKPVDLVEVGSLEFRKIDPARYPIWEIKDAVLENPHLGAVVNAANEVGIAQFFAGKIGFMDISRKTIAAYKAFEDFKPLNLEDVFEIDREVREFTERM